jgi:hypothetical protein
LCCLRARTPNIGEVEVAEFDYVTQSACCFRAKLELGAAFGVSGFRCVEPYQPDIRLLMIDPNGIAIDYSNVIRIDWLSHRWSSDEEEEEQEKH